MYRFSRDASRFSQDESRFSRESLKHLVWNILYMYYSQNVKKRLVSIQGAEESYLAVYDFNRLVTRLNVYSSITYSDLNRQQIGSLYNCTMNSTENTVKYDTSAPCGFRTSYNEALKHF